MVIRICAFTQKGWELVNTLEDRWTDCLFIKKDAKQDMEEWLSEGFAYHVPMVFVGATGIAVRMIAPYVKDKLTDSAVIVADEKGQFVIPLLSGHVGGANSIAKHLAQLLDAQAVFTTATDVEGLFSVDCFAMNNGFVIENREGIKKVSAKLLHENIISMAIHPSIRYEEEKVPSCIKVVPYSVGEADVVLQTNESGSVSSFTSLLTLVWKPYILGIGCKRDTPVEVLEKGLTEFLFENEIDLSQIAGMASIDLKKKEPGILYLEAKTGIAFHTFSAEELKAVEGSFEPSEFVEQITGVNNVCERAAAKLAGEAGQKAVPKTAKEKTTFALWERELKIAKWEM